MANYSYILHMQLIVGCVPLAPVLVTPRGYWRSLHGGYSSNLSFCQHCLLVAFGVLTHLYFRYLILNKKIVTNLVHIQGTSDFFIGG